MTPRIVPLVGSRLLPPGVLIDSWGGAPLTLSLTLDAGENISGATQLIAELHTSQKSSTAPLAQTVLAVTDNDGPWDLEFTSAQMNQNTNTADTRIVWLIVVAVYPSRVEPLVGRFVSLHRAAYSGANPLPPPVTVADIIDVENRVTDLEADVATLPATYATINSPVLTGVPTSPTAPASTATTQIASTAFVMSELSAAVSGLLDLKGNINAAANPNYPAAQKGDTYYVSAAGKVGGSSGKTVEIGDAVIAAADNAGGTEAAVGASWFILEKNMSGALLASNNLSDVSSTLTTLQNLGLSPNITLPGFLHVAGNVGIGTTSPAQPLDVSGKIALGGTVIAYRPTSVTGTLVLGNGGSAITIGANNNTLVGISAGNSLTTGNGNTASGYNALSSNTTGSNNTASGFSALYYNTTGASNTASGMYALFSNTTGSYNTASGFGALRQHTTGTSNTASGYNALFSNTTGTANTALGYNALYYNTTSSNNTALGKESGRFIAGGSAENTTPSNSLFLGNNTKALTATDTNQVVIGYDATGLGSNTVVVGNDSITKTGLKGQVGIGTTSPAATAALDITSTTKGFLPPRMTTIQRDAIVSPPIGLIIYDTTANKVSVRVSSEWKYLAYETA